MASATARKDEKRQLAQFLGTVKQVSWWQGTIVHKIIEDHLIPSLQSGKWPSLSLLLAEASSLAKRQFEFSQAGLYRTVPKKHQRDDYCILAPHFFGEDIDPHLLDNSITVISTALNNLLSSQSLKQFLMKRPAYHREKKLHFKVAGTTIRAIPDLVVPARTEDGLDIIDWKVATTSGSYHFQVAVYALAAQATSWLNPYTSSGVHGYVVNLLATDPAVALDDPYVVNQETLSATIDIIYEKIERIQALTQGKKFKELDISQFMYARSVGTCAMCHWHQMCVEMGDGTPAKLLPHYQSGPTQLALPLI
jgi:hypothetical protein